MQTKLKYLAVVPARKNSKRLPGKNLRPLNGKALVLHSIDYALSNQNLLREIIVSSDDEAVLDLAAQSGVRPLQRPAALANDTASSVSVLKHVLTQHTSAFDAVILLQPTNPFRKKGLLTEAITLFENQLADSLLTVSPLNKKFGKIENGCYRPVNYQIGQRSQDMEKLYYENGLIYITRSTLIMEDKMLGDNPLTLITDYPEAEIDIDTADDFRLAEWYAQTFTG